jgi:hypothetical protein
MRGYNDFNDDELLIENCYMRHIVFKEDRKEKQNNKYKFIEFSSVCEWVKKYDLIQSEYYTGKNKWINNQSINQSINQSN